MRNLIVGGVVVHHLQALRLSQSYEDATTRDIIEMGDGGVRIQTYGDEKLRSTIRGTGRIPPALMQVDYSTPMIVSCIQKMTIDVDALTTSVDLPVARRSDAGSTPIALAFFADSRRVVKTDVSMVGNTANITPVANAVGYEVAWWPELLCAVTKPTIDHSAGSLFEWSMTLREA